MAEYGTLPKFIEIFRGCDKKLNFNLINKSTKLPIDYTGQTFSAILIDQQEKDYTILATWSIGPGTCLTACCATLQFVLSNTITSCLYNDQSYLRIYRHAAGEKYIYIIGEVQVKD